MPLYDYKCTECSHLFEIQQKITEEPLKFCPLCKGPIKRLISAAGIVFKGSGFHVTDYGKKPHKEEKKKEEKKPETTSSEKPPAKK